MPDKIRIMPQHLDDESLRERLNEFASDGEYESYFYKSLRDLEHWLADMAEYVQRRRDTELDS